MRQSNISGREENLFLLGRLCERFGLGDALRYIEELGTSPLIDEIEAAVAHEPSFTTKAFSSVFEFRLFRLALYTLVRETKPEIVVETGVLHGLTSAFILEALKRNGSGRLYSIDLPSVRGAVANKDGIDAFLPESRASGWIVPDRLRPRWSLQPGASMDILPEIFQNVPQIDMFLHDSDHVYNTMWDEIVLTWKHLRDGGVLVCDNIDFSRAFFDFCRRIDTAPFVLSAPAIERHMGVRFAILRK